MPVSSLLSHVGSVLFGGEQSFFYTSTPTDAAISLRWRCQKAGPWLLRVRPAWRRDARPRVRAGALCAFQSAEYCGHTFGFGVPAFPDPCIADALAGRPLCKTQKDQRSPECSYPGHTVARSVHAPTQE